MAKAPVELSGMDCLYGHEEKFLFYSTEEAGHNNTRNKSETNLTPKDSPHASDRNCCSSQILNVPGSTSTFQQHRQCIKKINDQAYDKVAAVRKASVLSLHNLYEVDDNVPSLGLFTERFCNRMIELADGIDISVAVSAIGLLKLLLRHQLLIGEELGPLYDLLVNNPPMIRRAVGELVYDHLIAQNVKGSTSGEDDKTSEVHLGKMLQILREFPDDPILNAYVIA